MTSLTSVDKILESFPIQSVLLFSNPVLGLAWMNTAAAVAKNNQGHPLFVVRGIK
jgi:hypothetical protein